VIATSPRSPLSRGVVDALLAAYPRQIRFLSEYAFMVAHDAEEWPATRARITDLLQRLGACDTQVAARPS